MSKLEPLAITCTSTKCDDGLHCFLQKKRIEKHSVGGPCRACNADLVVWHRVQKRNLDDVEYTFKVQRQELIRHEFWHREFDEKALNHARKKGRVQLRVAVDKRLRTSIGREMNPMEGRQTPFEGNVIFYAQHALACCCRKCMEYWHGVEPGRVVTDDEIEYFTSLVEMYIQQRLPELPDEPQKVPSRRRRG